MKTIKSLKKMCAIALSAALLGGNALTVVPMAAGTDTGIVAKAEEYNDFDNLDDSTVTYSNYGDFSYSQRVDDGSITITGYSGTETDIVIPDSINGYRVIAIDDVAFWGNNSLINIIIPDSVTKIGDNAFTECNGLVSIAIPDSVTSIGEAAFSGCRNLRSVTIPDSVTSIGEKAFYECESLVGIIIPDSVTTINDESFSYCTSLENITIPESVTTIGKNAFSCCESLVSITIPNGVTTIDDSAFSGCISLSSVVMPNSLTSIGNTAFLGCYSLENILIPENVKKIGTAACGYYYNIDYENDGIKYIKKTGFIIYGDMDTAAETYAEKNGIEFRSQSEKNLENNSVVDKINLDYEIGDKVTVTGAASGGSGLYTFEFFFRKESEGQWYRFDSNGKGTFTLDTEGKYIIRTCVYDGDSQEAVKYFFIYADEYPVPDSNEEESGFTYSQRTDDNSITITGYFGSETHIDIPFSIDGCVVTAIDDSAFLSCTDLESITIPETVTSIGDYAFEGCTNLESINIPDSVTSIGNEVFYECYSLTSITIPKNVISIGDKAFSDCINLEYIKIPDSVISIGDETFCSCCSLESITLPDSITSIGNGVFYGCNSLENIIISENVTSIGSEVFYGCSFLTSITIPKNVISIGDKAFSDCINLTNVKIPDSVTSIGDEAFYNCNSLTSVTIPDCTTKIGGYAFGFGYDNYSKIDNFTIYGTIGSNAEAYAKENGFIFVNLGSKPLENKTTVSKNNFNVGETITVKGAAVGGTGLYTYEFYYKRSTASSWTRFDKNGNGTFKPGSAGTFTIKTYVKDSTGKAAVKEFSLTATNPPLTNNTTVTKTSFNVGETITVKGAAVGGTGSYSYEFYYKRSTASSWTRFDKNGTGTFKPGSAGTFTIKTYVKDSTGKASVKEFSLTAK